jgi:hypothetical protein
MELVGAKPIPVPEWEPDRTRFNPKSTRVAQNLIPTGDGWGPFNTLSALSGALGEDPKGTFQVKAANGTIRIFVGTVSDIYEISTTDYTFTSVGKAGGYGLAATDRWTFTTYGDTLVATVLPEYPQYITMSGGSQFADLTTSFKARFCAGVGDYLMFAHLTSAPNDVRWSGVNDATYYTNGKRGADTQTLPNGGEIRGIVVQEPNALIFQEEKIRSAVFDPASGYTFSFPTAHPNRGVSAPYSIVNIAPGDFVYYSPDGFFRGLETVPIGKEKVDSWFNGQADLQSIDTMFGVADPFNKIVWWIYPTGSNNAMIGYDWGRNRWCYTTETPLDLCQAATPGYSLDSAAAAAFGHTDNVPYGPDARFWAGGVPGFAGFTSGQKFGFFDGSSLAAVLETADLQPRYPRRTFVRRSSALMDSDAFTIALGTKENEDDAYSFGSDKSVETNTQWTSNRGSGRFIKQRVKIPAGTTWSHIVGTSMDHEDGGQW